MLYVGVNAEINGYVRFDARAATSSGATPPRCETTACPSVSIPRRPARPESCVYSPADRETCAEPFHFVSDSMTTVRAGILIPSASVSVAYTILTRPRENRCSTLSFMRGSMPAWCAAMPRMRPRFHASAPRTMASSGGRSAMTSST